MTKTIPAIAVIAFALALAGCGNKGSLVLPDATATDADASVVPTPAAADPNATDQAVDDTGETSTPPFDAVPNLTTPAETTEPADADDTDDTDDATTPAAPAPTATPPATGGGD